MKIATLALIIKGDSILLGSKQGHPEIGSGTLNGPGGKVEADETALTCIVRETWEEFQIRLDPHELQKVAIVVFYAAGVPDFEVHVFRTTFFTGEPRETTEMIPEWFPVDKIPYDRMLESDRHWFPQALHGSPFCAKVHYQKRGEGFEKIEFFPFTDPFLSV